MTTRQKRRELLGVLTIVAGTLLLLVPLWLRAEGFASPDRAIIQVFIGVFLIAKGIFWLSASRHTQ